MTIILIAILFFVVAFFYSSVGFGGGSSYLAILSVLLIDFQEIRTLALVLNVVVVSIGTFNYIRHHVTDWKAFWPFLITSIPLAFIGAQFRLSETVFFLILGGALLISAAFMWLQALQMSLKEQLVSRPKSMFLGGAIGLLSGVVGIGGGIFLSPTLNLLNWRTPRTIAALASVFILLNSLAGIGGLVSSGQFEVNLQFTWPLVLAVGIGGMLGSAWSSSKLKLGIIRNLTALLVAYVGARLILLHGFGIHI